MTPRLGDSDCPDGPVGGFDSCERDVFRYNAVVRLATATASVLTLLALLGGCAQEVTVTGTPMITQVRRAPWSGHRTTGITLTSTHYRIYTTSNNHALLKYTPGFMEAAYQNYMKLTGLSVSGASKPMPIYLMANRNQWAILTKKIVGGKDGPHTSIEAGGYCYQGTCVFWDLGGLSTFSVASHEGLHQFFYHNLRDRLPMWLEEGLCVTAEGYEIRGQNVAFTPDRNVPRFSNLRNAIIQGYWIPLRKLLRMHSMDAVGGYTEKAVGYYGQLWALVQFLRSQPKYRAGLERLLADAQASRLHLALNLPPKALDDLRRHGLAYNRVTSEPLFRHYISADLGEFERQYLVFAKHLAKLR